MIINVQRGKPESNIGSQHKFNMDKRKRNLKDETCVQDNIKHQNVNDKREEN